MKAALLALLAIGCAVEGGECRDPQSLDLHVVSRETTCEPDMDVTPAALQCTQTAGDVDQETCEFHGTARCSGEVEARVWYTLREQAHGRATYRRLADGCEVTLDLAEQE